MEKQTIEQAKKFVRDSMPSIFSQTDVLELLSSIEIPEVSYDDLPEDVKNNLREAAAKDFLSDVADNLEHAIDNLSTDDIVDLNTAQMRMSMHGNEVELEEVDIDTSNLKDALVLAVKETDTATKQLTT